GWNWALDNFLNGANKVDPRIQQTTANILNRFLGPGPGPDFTLSASPSSRTVTPGGSTSYDVTISPTGGFTDPVTLSVSGLPTGATGSFTPIPATTPSPPAWTSGPGTPLSASTHTVPGIRHTPTNTPTLSLGADAPADFTLSAAPASQTVTQGGSTSYAVTISPTGGFTDQVTLSVSGLPNGATGGFTPNPATTSSTLSVSTSPSTPTGTYTLTITGVSGSLTHTTTVTLVVNAPPNFTLRAAPARRTVPLGRSPPAA